MCHELRFATACPESSFKRDCSLCHGHFQIGCGSLFMICTGTSSLPEDMIAIRVTREIVRRIFLEADGRDPEELFRCAVRESNEMLYGMSFNDAYPHGMGADLAALLLDPTGKGKSLACHVGCNRIFLVRGGSVGQITRQHPRLRGIWSGGVSGHSCRDRSVYNVAAGAIGMSTEVSPEITEIDVESGDRYVICSACISDSIPIRSLLDLADEDAEICARSILDISNARDDHRYPLVQIVDCI